MYETWDIDIPSIPERSRLYYVEPIGVGTPYTECLTSYMIRLAEAHCVTLEILVKHEILPLLQDRSGISALFSNNRFGSAHTLNGTSSISQACVHAIERLTGQNDLHALTMLTWVNVIYKRGLLRNIQAWCPFGYEEWQKSKTPIYTPLLWSISAVKVCSRHHQVLQDRCPYCQRTLPVFALRLRLGYCIFCNLWLGNSPAAGSRGKEAIPQEDLEKVYWDEFSVGELIEVASGLSSPARREAFAAAITSLVNQFPRKNAASLADHLSIPLETVAAWQKGTEVPRFESLLLICRLLDITPRCLFLEKAPTSDFTFVERDNQTRLVTSRKNRAALCSEELRQALEDILMSGEEPAPSIKEVARRLGYSNQSPLYRRFPELCRAITAKHQGQNPGSRRLQRKDMSAEELRQALEDILRSNEDPAPSVDEVAARLGYRGSSSLRKRFPELCHAITARHLVQPNMEQLQRGLEAVLECADSAPTLEEVARHLGCPSRLLRRRFPGLCRAIVLRRVKPTDFEGLRAALERELQSNREPRSMLEVARDLEYPVRTLLRLFPDMCHEIAMRGQAHRKRNSELRTQRIRDEVSRVALSMHAEKKYPSFNQVMAHVDHTCVCPPFIQIEAYVPWKEVLMELGYLL